VRQYWQSSRTLRIYLSQDVRYAVRALLEKSRIHADRDLGLARGINANTAIFTVVDRVFTPSATPPLQSL
jgi:hypothetical protein